MSTAAASRPSLRWQGLEALAAVGQPLLLTLALSSLAELLLLRTFSRVGLYLPKAGLFAALYSALTALGAIAFNLALVALFLVLGLLVLRLALGWEATRQGRWLAAAVALPSLLALVGLFAPPSAAYDALYALAAVCALAPVVAYGLSRMRNIAEKAALLLVLAASLAQVFYGLSGFAAAGAQAGSISGAGLAVMRMGEALVVTGAFAFFFAYGPGYPGKNLPQWRPALLALLPSLAFAALYQVNSATTSILSLWSVGLSLYLPWPLYALALFCYLYSALRSWELGERHIAVALVLLLAGGYTYQVSTQPLLTLLAALLLACPGRTLVTPRA